MKGRIAVRVRRSVIVLTMIGVTVPSFGVEREYVDRARLTESEEALVLKMARNRGIAESEKWRRSGPTTCFPPRSGESPCMVRIVPRGRFSPGYGTREDLRNLPGDPPGEKWKSAMPRGHGAIRR